MTLYGYFPLMSASYLFYYIINVAGLIEFNEIDFPRFYNFGFYYFRNPELEFPIIYSAIFVIGLYVRLNIRDEYKERDLMRILQKYTPITYSWVYLSLVNCEILVFIYAVIFSLIAVDIYHMLILFAMVIA